MTFDRIVDLDMTIGGSLGAPAPNTRPRSTRKSLSDAELFFRRSASRSDPVSEMLSELVRRHLKRFRAVVLSTGASPYPSVNMLTVIASI